MTKPSKSAKIRQTVVTLTYQDGRWRSCPFAQSKMVHSPEEMEPNFL